MRYRAIVPVSPFTGIHLPIDKSNLAGESVIEIDWIKLIAPGANREWDF